MVVPCTIVQLQYKLGSTVILGKVADLGWTLPVRHWCIMIAAGCRSAPVISLCKYVESSSFTFPMMAAGKMFVNSANIFMRWPLMPRRGSYSSMSCCSSCSSLMLALRLATKSREAHTAITPAGFWLPYCFNLSQASVPPTPPCVIGWYEMTLYSPACLH